MTPEDTVRAYFAAYSEGQPDQFAEIVSPDYVDYGHTPPGRGPKVSGMITSRPSSSLGA